LKASSGHHIKEVALSEEAKTFLTRVLCGLRVLLVDFQSFLQYMEKDEYFSANKGALISQLATIQLKGSEIEGEVKNLRDVLKKIGFYDLVTMVR